MDIELEQKGINEEGTSMIEFSICIFFFIYTSFVLWEVGNALIAYQKLSSIASEGLLVASRSDLSENTKCIAEVSFDTSDSSYEAFNGSSDFCGISSANGQILDLISENYQIISTLGSKIVVSTELVSLDQDPTTSDEYSEYEKQMNDKVIVEIYGTFKGLLISLDLFNLSLDVSVVKEGPYLK